MRCRTSCCSALASNTLSIEVSGPSFCTVGQPELGGPGAAAQRVQGKVRRAQVRVRRHAKRFDVADQRVEARVQVGDALPEAGRAFVGQQIHRELPTVAGVSEHAVGGHDDVVEVHLAELVDAVHGAQRAHVDAGTVHVDEEGGDAGMTGSGPGQQNAPRRVLGEAGPHLLPVDHPVVTTLLRAGRQGRKVATRAGLGEALAPGFLARQQQRHHLGGQFGRRVVDHRRRQDLEHRVRPGFVEAAAHDLLADDRPQDHGSAEPARRFGPAPTHPARVVQRAEHPGVLGVMCVQRVVAGRGRQVVLVEPRNEL